jgi:hypothetical protein
MTKAPDSRGLAVFYLALYNLMFILPLVTIFIVALFGVTNEQLTTFLKKYTSTIKILLAILFFGLAFFLIRNIDLF